MAQSEKGREPETEKKRVLRSIYLFSGLGDNDLESLARLAISRKFYKDAVIFWENREAQGFYILLQGHVKLVKSSPDGKEFILRLVAPGETFGEAAVLAEVDYPVTADRKSVV